MAFSSVYLLNVSNCKELKLDRKVVSTQANDFMSIFKNNGVQGHQMSVHCSLLRESGFEMTEMLSPGKYRGS